MTTQTFFQAFNSPGNNVGEFAFIGAFGVIGTITTWSAKCEAWSGANGTGSRVTCGGLSAFNLDYTTGDTVLNRFDGTNINTATATTGQGTSGHILRAGGKWQTSGSPGSLVITVTYDNSFGILQPLVRRSGVWTLSTSRLSVRRSSAWVGKGVRVRRSGVWIG